MIRLQSLHLVHYLIGSILPWGYLEAIHLLMQNTWDWKGALGRWLFVLAVFGGGWWGQGIGFHKDGWFFPWRFVLLVATGLVAGLVYAITMETTAAWVMTGAFYALLVSAVLSVQSVEQVGNLPYGLQPGNPSTQKPPGAKHITPHLRKSALICVLIITLLGGILPVAIEQIETNFAEEEFFSALKALVLSGFAFLCFCSARILKPPAGLGTCRRFKVPTLIGVVLLIILIAWGTWGFVRAYQHSFYSLEAPSFPGITPETPFICGQVTPEPDTPDGVEVFRRLVKRVEANPRKGPEEYGMLALATGEQKWAEAFRESLLEEAKAGAFTGPAHSVKSVQFSAARRVYYLHKVAKAFPGLFSEGDWVILQGWLAAINRRALTVEWVDLMYALAFSKWPEGPYENQENGAGLLALLEAYGFSPQDLSPRNRDYLLRNRRGWFQRFRVTDDAFVYQPEWITNALFQMEFWSQYGHSEDVSLHSPLAPRLLPLASFNWLLLQSLPDGAPLGYNHPARHSLAGIAYLGARLTGDPRFLWLSARSLDWLEANGGYAFAQPGTEEPIELKGVSPAEGSCLIYGDSGLPNQKGPLAPDKIVFRDGWSPQSTYMLLNLRFAGWHRYKATNTITLLYKGGPLVIDKLRGEPYRWLPRGRSLFRDKRIPRENLSGLLVSKTGMAAVLYGLTGFGSPWAQDPPHYAKVEHFETGDGLDISRTVIENWRGWRHTRTIYFHHNGPIVIVDEAEGPSRSQAALVWHLVGEGQQEGNILWLRKGPSAVGVEFPEEVWANMDVEVHPQKGEWEPNIKLLYRSPQRGRLKVTTVFHNGVSHLSRQGARKHSRCRM